MALYSLKAAALSIIDVAEKVLGDDVRYPHPLPFKWLAIHSHHPVYIGPVSWELLVSVARRQVAKEGSQKNNFAPLFT